MENRETKTYPLLPLRGLIAFPNLPLSLDVGREKSVQALRAALENGAMVLLGNPSHAGGRPLLVGQPSRVKVNANIGTSPFQNHVPCEMRKLETALAAGADTVMDLSIAGDLTAIRASMLAACPAPLEKPRRAL